LLPPYSTQLTNLLIRKAIYDLYITLGAVELLEIDMKYWIKAGWLIQLNSAGFLE